MAGLLMQGSFLLYGTRYFSKGGYERMVKSENYENIENVNLKGKHVMVTGANSGLGYDTSLWFAKHNATVHLVCRSKEKGEVAVDEIKKESNNTEIHLHICDLAEPKEIKDAMTSYQQQFGVLDILVNNAGVMLHTREVNSEGIEKTFATNTLSTYLVTNLLIPCLAKSSDPRVIIVSSGGMLTEKLQIKEEYETPSSQDKWDGTSMYAKTKRHQIALTEIFAEKHKNMKIVSMHPGWSATPGVQNSMPGFYKTFKDKLRTQQQGSDTICWLGVTDKLKLEDSGKFYRDREEEIKHFCLGKTKYTPDQAKELWEWCYWCCKASAWSE